MAFESLTLEDQHAFLLASYKRTFPDADVGQLSHDWLWLLTFAAGVTDNHAHIESTKNDLLPDTAPDDGMLDRWGRILNVPRGPATPARKASSLRIVATSGAVPDGTTLGLLEHEESGQLYRIVDFAGDPVGLPGGFADVGIEAVGTGRATRRTKGESLRFVVTPAPNIEDVAELQLDVDDDGEDREDPGAYRLRILSRISSPPLGGAQEDYVQWALEEPEIAAAFAYPLRRGAGSVDVTALHKGSGAARILTEGERGDLEAKMNAKRPVSVRAFRVLKVVAEPANVEVTIQTNGEPAYAFDWDDSTPPNVNAYNAGTRTVTLDEAARPPSMDAGDRVIVSDGATGRERVIETLGPGANEFVFEADSNADEPTGASVLYSGGPVVQPVRRAILALIDSLGTANPDAKRYGAWEGNLRPSALSRVATAITGVLDGAVVTPAATVEASDPTAIPTADDTVGLITPGRIIVRRA